MAAALGHAPSLEGDARLYVVWRLDPDGPDPVEAARTVVAAGGVPWLRVTLTTPAPPVAHAARLAEELERLASIARRAPPTTHFQLEWRPPEPPAGAPEPRSTAFVLKRAAVAVAGAAPDARVLAGGLEPDPSWLEMLYREDLGAYVDGLVFRDRPGGPAPRDLADIAGAVDPGRPVVRAGAVVADAEQAVLAAASDAAAGIAVTLFELPAGAPLDLAPMVVAARELQGDLAYDPSTSPAGGWAFVRGSDLGLRVVAAVGPAAPSAELSVPEPALRDPVLVRPDGGTEPLTFRRTASGVVVTVPDPPPVVILRLERMTAAELGGFETELGVTDRVTMPVEEILSRLQASEDAQARRLEHYEADFTTHLRFRLTEGTQPIEVTFRGPFFRRADGSFDWAWEVLRFNGVRWRGQIPDLPLIQPEKAAAMPLEIHLTAEYRYRLRGVEPVDGRDCWVVEFEPARPVDGRSLYRGTVWIDREHFVRVRTRSLQLGLGGDVLSNDETVEFAPVDADGRRVAWSRDAFVLPVRTVGQELQSILNTVVLVEKESLLENVRINRDGFDLRLAEVHATDRTMVRDTATGLRYLDRQPDGSRRVREKDDPSRLFALFGAYYDDSLDYPLPLGGLNWFTRDLRGTGLQANVFFAGAFVNANLAQPAVAGSRWDAGARLFGLFVPFEQEQFRDGVEVPEEALESRSGRLALFLGRPLGSYAKLDLTYGLEWDEYGRADDTADGFRPPSDTLTHTIGAELSYTRGGWTAVLAGAAARRDDWAPWGFPGDPAYDPADSDYRTWRASLTKSWWLNGFTRLGVQLEHLDGAHLDRFSSYDFSFFSGSRVAGYPSGLVTATRADGLHATYGFNLGDVLRLEGNADLVWATDDRSGLDRERLAGVGVSGSLVGPWQTIVTFDVGLAVDGPADSVAASVVFLKLF